MSGSLVAACLAAASTYAGVEDRLSGVAEEPQPRPVTPADVNAERWVLASVLSGQFRLADFPGLQAKHFQSGWHRLLWVAADCVEGAKLPMTLGRICMALEALGNGPAAKHAERVADLVNYTPFRIRQDGEVARILEMSKRRELMRWAKRFASRVGSGELSAKQARAYLRQVGARA